MDVKQLVALWYGGIALVMCHVMLGVSGFAIAGLAGVGLFVLAVRLVWVRHSAQRDVALESAGPSALIGLLVLGAIVVGAWRANSIVSVVSEVDATNDAPFAPALRTAAAFDAALSETVFKVRGGEHVAQWLAGRPRTESPRPPSEPDLTTSDSAPPADRPGAERARGACLPPVQGNAADDDRPRDSEQPGRCGSGSVRQVYKSRAGSKTAARTAS